MYNEIITSPNTAIGLIWDHWLVRKYLFNNIVWSDNIRVYSERRFSTEVGCETEHHHPETFLKYLFLFAPQLRFKPVPIPPREPDYEVFGKNDTTNEKIAERRRRAHLLFQEQQDLVGQRKREAILKRLAEQDREQAVLEKTKDGWVNLANRMFYFFLVTRPQN